MCVYQYKWPPTQIDTYMYAYAFVWIYIYIYIYMNKLKTHTHIYIYIYIYVCVCVCVCVCTRQTINQLGSVRNNISRWYWFFYSKRTGKFYLHFIVISVISRIWMIKKDIHYKPRPDKNYHWAANWPVNHFILYIKTFFQQKYWYNVPFLLDFHYIQTDTIEILVIHVYIYIYICINDLRFSNTTFLND